jgi:hypothetical protein
MQRVLRVLRVLRVGIASGSIDAFDRPQCSTVPMRGPYATEQLPMMFA